MENNPVVVYIANGQLHAASIKIFLEAAGIPTWADQESAGVVHGLTVGPLGAVEILVPASFEKDARELLDKMERGELEINSSPYEATEDDEGNGEEAN